MDHCNVYSVRTSTGVKVDVIGVLSVVVSAKHQANNRGTTPEVKYKRMDLAIVYPQTWHTNRLVQHNTDTQLSIVAAGSHCSVLPATATCLYSTCKSLQPLHVSTSPSYGGQNIIRSTRWQKTDQDNMCVRVNACLPALTSACPPSQQLPPQAPCGSSALHPGYCCRCQHQTLAAGAT